MSWRRPHSKRSGESRLLQDRRQVKVYLGFLLQLLAALKGEESAPQDTPKTSNDQRMSLAFIRSELASATRTRARHPDTVALLGQATALLTERPGASNAAWLRCCSIVARCVVRVSEHLLRGQPPRLRRCGQGHHLPDKAPSTIVSKLRLVHSCVDRVVRERLQKLRPGNCQLCLLKGLEDKGSSPTQSEKGSCREGDGAPGSVNAESLPAKDNELSECKSTYDMGVEVPVGSPLHSLPTHSDRFLGGARSPPDGWDGGMRSPLDASQSMAQQPDASSTPLDVCGSTVSSPDLAGTSSPADGGSQVVFSIGPRTPQRDGRRPLNTGTNNTDTRLSEANDADASRTEASHTDTVGPVETVVRAPTESPERGKEKPVDVERQGAEGKSAFELHFDQAMALQPETRDEPAQCGDRVSPSEVRALCERLKHMYSERDDASGSGASAGEASDSAGAGTDEPGGRADNGSPLDQVFYSNVMQILTDSGLPSGRESANEVSGIEFTVEQRSLITRIRRAMELTARARLSLLALYPLVASYCTGAGASMFVGPSHGHRSRFQTVDGFGGSGESYVVYDALKRCRQRMEGVRADTPHTGWSQRSDETVSTEPSLAAVSERLRPWYTVTRTWVLQFQPLLTPRQPTGGGGAFLTDSQPPSDSERTAALVRLLQRVSRLHRQLSRYTRDATRTLRECVRLNLARGTVRAPVKASPASTLVRKPRATRPKPSDAAVVRALKVICRATERKPTSVVRRKRPVDAAAVAAREKRSRLRRHTRVTSLRVLMDVCAELYGVVRGTPQPSPRSHRQPESRTAAPAVPRLSLQGLVPPPSEWKQAAGSPLRDTLRFSSEKSQKPSFSFGSAATGRGWQPDRPLTRTAVTHCRSVFAQPLPELPVLPRAVRVVLRDSRSPALVTYEQVRQDLQSSQPLITTARDTTSAPAAAAVQGKMAVSDTGPAPYTFSKHLYPQLRVPARYLMMLYRVWRSRRLRARRMRSARASVEQRRRVRLQRVSARKALLSYAHDKQAARLMQAQLSTTDSGSQQAAEKGVAVSPCAVRYAGQSAAKQAPRHAATALQRDVVASVRLERYQRKMQRIEQLHESKTQRTQRGTMVARKGVRSTQMRALFERACRYAVRFYERWVRTENYRARRSAEEMVRTPAPSVSRTRLRTKPPADTWQDVVARLEQEIAGKKTKPKVAQRASPPKFRWSPELQTQLAQGSAALTSRLAAYLRNLRHVCEKSVRAGWDRWGLVAEQVAARRRRVRDWQRTHRKRLLRDKRDAAIAHTVAPKRSPERLSTAKKPLFGTPFRRSPAAHIGAATAAAARRPDWFVEVSEDGVVFWGRVTGERQRMADATAPRDHGYGSIHSLLAQQVVKSLLALESEPTTSTAGSQRTETVVVSEVKYEDVQTQEDSADGTDGTWGAIVRDLERLDRLNAGNAQAIIEEAEREDDTKQAADHAPPADSETKTRTAGLRDHIMRLQSIYRSTVPGKALGGVGEGVPDPPCGQLVLKQTMSVEMCERKIRMFLQDIAKRRKLWCRLVRQKLQFWSQCIRRSQSAREIRLRRPADPPTPVETPSSPHLLAHQPWGGSGSAAAVWSRSRAERFAHYVDRTGEERAVQMLAGDPRAPGDGNLVEGVLSELTSPDAGGTESGAHVPGVPFSRLSEPRTVTSLTGTSDQSRAPVTHPGAYSSMEVAVSEQVLQRRRVPGGSFSQAERRWELPDPADPGVRVDRLMYELDDRGSSPQGHGAGTFTTASRSQLVTPSAAQDARLPLDVQGAESFTRRRAAAAVFPTQARPINQPAETQPADIQHVLSEFVGPEDATGAVRSGVDFARMTGRDEGKALRDPKRLVLHPQLPEDTVPGHVSRVGRSQASTWESDEQGGVERAVVATLLAKVSGGSSEMSSSARARTEARLKRIIGIAEVDEPQREEEFPQDVGFGTRTDRLAWTDRPAEPSRLVLSQARFPEGTPPPTGFTVSTVPRGSAEEPELAPRTALNLPGPEQYRFSSAPVATISQAGAHDTADSQVVSRMTAGRLLPEGDGVTEELERLMQPTVESALAVQASDEGDGISDDFITFVGRVLQDAPALPHELTEGQGAEQKRNTPLGPSVARAARMGEASTEDVRLALLPKTDLEMGRSLPGLQVDVSPVRRLDAAEDVMEYWRAKEAAELVAVEARLASDLQNRLLQLDQMGELREEDSSESEEEGSQ